MCIDPTVLARHIIENAGNDPHELTRWCRELSTTPEDICDQAGVDDTERERILSLVHRDKKVA